MNRRSFILSILAAGVAPAIARSGILMPVKELILPSGGVIEIIQQGCFYTPTSPWQAKSSAEILADMNIVLSKMREPFVLMPTILEVPKSLYAKAKAQDIHSYQGRAIVPVSRIRT